MRILFLLFVIGISLGCDKNLPPPPCDYEGVLLYGGDVYFKPYPKGCPGEEFRMHNDDAVGSTVVTSQGKRKALKYAKEVERHFELMCK